MESGKIKDSKYAVWMQISLALIQNCIVFHIFPVRKYILLCTRQKLKEKNENIAVLNK